MPPTGGVGANTALQDSATLASELLSVAKGDKSLIEAVAAYERVMLPRGFDTVDSSPGWLANCLALTTEGCLWWRRGYLAKPGTASGSRQPLDSLLMRGGAVKSDLITKLPDMPERQVLLAPHLGAQMCRSVPPCTPCSPAAVFQKGCDG